MEGSKREGCLLFFSIHNRRLRHDGNEQSEPLEHRAASSVAALDVSLVRWYRRDRDEDAIVFFAVVA